MKKTLLGFIIYIISVVSAWGANFPIITYSERGSDVSVTQNTVTTVLTHTLVMPSMGCPCRVQAFWAIWGSANSNSTIEAWLDDGKGSLNIFGGSVNKWISSGNDGFSGSGISRNYYNPDESVTITLKIQSFGANATVTTNYGAPNHVPTWLQTIIVSGD